MRKLAAGLAVIGMTAACWSSLAIAQDYPTKTVTILSPSSPAGGIDLPARIYMPELAKRWKQSIVIDNRPGAAGSLAHDFAARAQPDGYTLYINSDTAMAYGATGQSEYDAEK